MVHEVLEHGDHGKRVKCLSCGSPYEGFFCFDCHTILPISGEMSYFAILEVEKRPVVDMAKLKENFLRLSDSVHPDRYFNSSPEIQDLALKSSSLLNKAYSTLKDPKERIRYLISLENDRETPVSKHASAETMEFFIDASDVCNEVSSLVKKKVSDEHLMRDYLKKLQGLRNETNERWKGVLEKIEAVDKEWVGATEDNRKPLVRRLLILSHELSYLSKLQSLIDELIVTIS